MNLGLALAIGLLAGAHTSTWGMYKDGRRDLGGVDSALVATGRNPTLALARGPRYRQHPQLLTWRYRFAPLFAAIWIVLLGNIAVSLSEPTHGLLSRPFSQE